jgi:hypothetical protein
MFLGDDNLGDAVYGSTENVKASWNRSQMASKAWLMMYQLQFTALTAMVGITLPTSYLAYTNTLSWSLLSVGSFWTGKNHNVFASSSPSSL